MSLTILSVTCKHFTGYPKHEEPSVAELAGELDYWSAVVRAPPRSTMQACIHMGLLSY